MWILGDQGRVGILERAGAGSWLMRGPVCIYRLQRDNTHTLTHITLHYPSVTLMLSEILTEYHGPGRVKVNTPPSGT